MARMNGAQALIATLRTHNVSTIFGIPGVHTLPIYEAIRAESGLRHVLARHEQGAGFMADGYARVSGRPGVVCTITGPGVTNVTTAMADAYADSLPVLVVSSSLPRSSAHRPSGDLHELKNQHGVMESLVGWTRSVNSVAEIPDALRDAFRTMSAGRPRGAYLQIPLDLLSEVAEVSIPSPAPVTRTAPDPDAIRAAAQLLRQAQRPLIVAGNGITAAGANEQLARLAELLQAPVLLGSKSRAVLPSTFPLVLATSGYAIPDALHDLVWQADVVLVVGSKLGDQRTAHKTLPLPAALIHIDIDPAELGLRYPAKVGVVADARLALEALLAALADLHSSPPSRAAEITTVRMALEALATRSYGASLGYLQAVRVATPHDGVIVADMTMLGYAATESLPVFGPRTFVHAGELCTIGCGLPLALGAKIAAPERAVIALCGDGGFLQNTGELATAVQERIAVVIVLFNDATYTAVKDEQRRSFAGNYIATDLIAPDYAALARAFGAHGVRAEDPDRLREAIEMALRQEGPTLIEVPLPREA